MGKMRGFLRKNKAKAAGLGVNAVFAYGFVSNVNVGITLALAWYTFCRSSGLSPLAGGQWSKFLLTYATIYATLGTVLRPVRIAAAAWITPAYGKVISWLQTRLPFRESRPKLNRSLAITVTVLVGNILATSVVAAIGIWIASTLVRVPILPPKGPAILR